MRTLKIVLFVAAAVALLPAIATAAPGDGIAGTAHDFSGKSVTGGNGETFTTGSCTFCHTPHRAIQTLLLWNHTMSSATYSWDVPQTTAGTFFPSFTNIYTGPTVKCLSCHDGSVAVGDVAWFGEGKPPSVLDSTQHQWPDPFNLGATGGVLGSMKGNHPVAMPYPYGNAKNTYNGVTTGDEATLTEWQSPPLSPIRIFNDANGTVIAGASPGKTGIECSSCHDPHNKAAVDDLFLRGGIGGNVATTGAGYLCLKCHIK